MDTLSRDEHDASHSLFVMARPDLPTRYLFVHERSGDVTSFRAVQDETGATVARQSDRAFVRFTPALENETLKVAARRTSGDVASKVELVDGGRTFVFDLEGVRWSAVSEPGDRLEVFRQEGPDRVIVQPSGSQINKQSAAFDVWVRTDGEHEVTALQTIVEAMVIQRLRASVTRPD